MTDDPKDRRLLEAVRRLVRLNRACTFAVLLSKSKRSEQSPEVCFFFVYCVATQVKSEGVTCHGQVLETSGGPARLQLDVYLPEW